MMPNRRLIRDVSRVGKKSVFLIGVIAGLIVSPLKPGVLHGSLRTLAIHLLLSGIIAIGYGILLRSARRSGAGVGFQISIIHWIVAGTVVGLAPHRPDLSFFMLGQGAWSFVSYAIMHFIFGIVIGVLFDRKAIRTEYPLPLRNDPESLHFNTT
jgi:hypothetical protein